MSEPLNIFLEDLEVLVRQCGDDDAELGKRVRAAWTILLEQENAATADHVIVNHHGFPMTVPSER